jgi:hypothetical protein
MRAIPDTALYPSLLRPAILGLRGLGSRAGAISSIRVKRLGSQHYAQIGDVVQKIVVANA